MGLFSRSQTNSAKAQSVDGRGGWWPVIRESFAGAWQQNVEVEVGTVLTYGAVYRCVTLIASDIAKMRLRLVSESGDGVWTETKSNAFSPLFRKPNEWQTRIQFFETWMISKLTSGNTYILKRRDNRGVVVAMYVLDPARVKVLVSDSGAVFYELQKDSLSGQTDETLRVPAREIIHDRWNCIYHPLVGTSPIHACGLAATQGMRIQNNSARFFGNGSQPGGILSAPGAISDDTAVRLKNHWDSGYSGANAGKVAVLGDGLKFERMTMTAGDAQLIEQLRWTAEVVCSVFGVPAYKAGVGTAPAYNNIEALGQQYYTDCLQTHIESIEECLDDGLNLRRPLGAEFDLDTLFRMDTATLVEAEKNAVGAGIKAPNEARLRLNLPPVKGGETPYLQQQNYSLSALSRRDESGIPGQELTPPSPEVPTETPDDADMQRQRALVALHKGLSA